MLSNFRDWIVNEICFSFDAQQTYDLKQHMINHPSLWQTFIIKLKYDRNWLYFAQMLIESGLEIPASKVFSILNVLYWSKSFDDLKAILNSDAFHIEFDFHKVWFDTKTSDCNLGLLWHMFSDDNNNNKDVLYKYLQRIHDSSSIYHQSLWLEFVHRFSALFFKFFMDH